MDIFVCAMFCFLAALPLHMILGDNHIRKTHSMIIGNTARSPPGHQHPPGSCQDRSSSKAVTKHIEALSSSREHKSVQNTLTHLSQTEGTSMEWF